MKSNEFAKPLLGLDEHVEERMRLWKVPGFQLSVVKDGETAFDKIAYDISAKENGVAKIQREESKKKRIINTQPSHPLEDYSGAYAGPAHTELTVLFEGNLLVLQNRWGKMKLRHYHYDTFDVEDEDGGMLFKISFNTDVDGKISGIHMPVPELENPILFKRKKE